MGMQKSLSTGLFQEAQGGGERGKKTKQTACAKYLKCTPKGCNISFHGITTLLINPGLKQYVSCSKHIHTQLLLGITDTAT